MTDAGIQAAVRSYLSDHPEAEGALADLLERDAESSWSFEDVDLDSGLFGELVSRGIVEKTEGGEYRFVDRTAVRAVVESGEITPSTDTDESGPTDRSLTMAIDIERRVAVAFAGVLALVALARSIPYRSVYRDGRVVSPGNDPYFYRYWQGQLLEQSSGVTDIGVVANLPGGATSRPLTHSVNWWLAELLGGTPGAADTVAVWLPVVGAVISAGILYALVFLLLEDHRIALVSILLLALTPVHAVYTSLGFLEHRLHQYIWLLVLVVTLVWLAKRDDSAVVPSSRRTWLVVALLAVAVAASVHTWAGSPITFVPVAAYLGLRGLLDVRANVSPLGNAPEIAGIGAGSVLALVAHFAFGWHEFFVVIVPLVVTGGGIAVVLLAEGWHRTERSAKQLFVVEAGVAVVGLALFLVVVDMSVVTERVGDLFGRGGISETASLFAADRGIFLMILGQLGLWFFLSVVVLAFVTIRVARQYHPGWSVVVCFTWWYLILAAIQVRFAAQLSLFLSVFGGIGLVALLWKTDIARPVALFDEPSLEGLSFRFPQESAAVALGVGIVGFFLLFNFLFLPSFLGDAQHSDDKLAAVDAIDNHSETTDRGDTESYVLSPWSDNRFYNHFVSGEYSSYDYAQETYPNFTTAKDPDSWYEQLPERVGYVVVSESENMADSSENTAYVRLFEQNGTGEQAPGHYQLIHKSANLRVFALVEGAIIETTGEPGENVTARTNVTVNGESSVYERTATANENGTARIRVAYPGTYEVGEDTITVDQQDVENGESRSQAA